MISCQQIFLHGCTLSLLFTFHLCFDSADHQRETILCTSQRRINLDAHCCYMETAIKHPVPHWVKPSLVIFDIRAVLSVRVPGCQKITNDRLTRSDIGCFTAVSI